MFVNNRFGTVACVIYNSEKTIKEDIENFQRILYFINALLTLVSESAYTQSKWTDYNKKKDRELCMEMTQFFYA